MASDAGGAKRSAKANATSHCSATISARTAPPVSGPQTALKSCRRRRWESAMAKGRSAVGRCSSRSGSSQRSPWWPDSKRKCPLRRAISSTRLFAGTTLPEKPLLEERALREVLGQVQGASLRRSRLFATAEVVQQLGVCGMEQVIAVQHGRDRLQLMQRRRRTLDLPERDRTVEPDNRRRRQREQHVVQHDDLKPVRRLETGCLRMARGNRRLELVRPGPAEACRPCDQGNRLGHQGGVPSGAILIGKQDQLAGLRESGVATREMKLHQREQPEDLRLVRQQSRQERGQPGCILGKIALECGGTVR